MILSSAAIPPDPPHIPDDIWPTVLRDRLHQSTALPLGVFNSEGALLYANPGMTFLLDAAEAGRAPAEALVNPDFRTLIKKPPSESSVFEGIMTLTKGNSQYNTIRAAAYRKDDLLFIAGEFDVMEMNQMNEQMVALNREVNNLQRQLIKEKRMLEHTLGELRETQAMLIHSEKMSALGKMVAGVAHEINNPVAFVSSNLHSLKGSIADLMAAYADLETLFQHDGGEQRRQAAADIRAKYDLDFIFDDFEDLQAACMNGLNRVTKIVKDLRTFSRLDEAELKYVDIPESVDAALSIAGPELKKRQIEVRTAFEDLPHVECYSSDLNQVFLNLIINAAQAMETSGVITISGREVDGAVRLEFSDTGPGIPEEIAGQIFDPFFTTKPVGAGTGLGLSLAHKIIADKHRGAISVRSDPGKGATFILTIPKEQAHDKPST